jgi:hypothetical protein
MKGVHQLTTEMYQNKNGVWNFRITAKINLKPKPICLMSNNQGYENKSDCMKAAKGWVYNGTTPEFILLKKYYRLS